MKNNMKENHVVLTTINVPGVLLDLYENVKRFERLDSTACWVVGDYKTPPECEVLCKKVNGMGLETHFLDIPCQDEWGKRFPDFYKCIPYNNESRRNIGYLLALENGCKRMISIDDDNFPADDDFIGFHEIVSEEWDCEVVIDDSGFHNVCEYLQMSPDRKVYPRGFPFQMRSSQVNRPVFARRDRGTIGLNQGLWLKEPDIDATTWLNGSVESVGYIGDDSIVLGPGTWLPINTQNTCVARELIPAFFCVPMGFDVPGGRIERYGDIWGGYFFQALIKNSQFLISFGRPIVEHRRNPHDYLNDLRCEFWGMILTDWVLAKLKDEFTPEASNVIERLIELSAFLGESVGSLPGWCPDEMRRFMGVTSESIRLWVDVCKTIG